MTAPRSSPRVVLAGNGAAACATLALLRQARPAAELLVIAPPGGPLHSWQDSLQAVAGDAGVTCLAPARINDPQVVDQVAAFGADLLLSVYYTQIFRPDFLAAIPGPRLNVHPSLLPRHRGTAPLIWSIVEGDHRTGVTIHHLDNGVDTGHIVTSRILPINASDTGWTLHDKASRLATATIAELLRDWLAGADIPVGRPQEGGGCLHRKADGTLNRIDPDDSPERVERIARALAPPLPGAYLQLPGTDLIVTSLTCSDRSGPAGTLQVQDPDGPVYLLRNGAVRIDRFWDGQRERDGRELPGFLTTRQVA